MTNTGAGSIPAWAGEPVIPGNAFMRQVRVYPRVGGGTPAIDGCLRLPASKEVYPRVGGGTHASCQLPQMRPLAVYPRVGGGTAWNGVAAYCGEAGGLSPRGRGNPAIWMKGRTFRGHVGLSPRGRGNRKVPINIGVYRGRGNRRMHCRTVYPRVGGGTYTLEVYQLRPRRSIPAWAGEPECA